jgi:hypothetical protein
MKEFYPIFHDFYVHTKLSRSILNAQFHAFADHMHLDTKAAAFFFFNFTTNNSTFFLTPRYIPL